jgi:hypothetical protein
MWTHSVVWRRSPFFALLIWPKNWICVLAPEVHIKSGQICVRVSSPLILSWAASRTDQLALLLIPSVKHQSSPRGALCYQIALLSRPGKPLAPTYVHIWDVCASTDSVRVSSRPRSYQLSSACVTSAAAGSKICMPLVRELQQNSNPVVNWRDFTKWRRKFSVAIWYFLPLFDRPSLINEILKRWNWYALWCCCYDVLLR